MLGHLAKELKTDMSQIRYAGLKDKVAETTQFVTVCGVSLRNVNEVCGKSFTQWNVQQSCEGGSVSGDVVDELQLGDLSGNQFEIVVTDLKGAGGMSLICHLSLVLLVP